MELSDFVRRHIGPSEEDQRRMLETLGVGSARELVDQAVPPTIRNDDLALPPGRSEVATTAALRAIAERNRPVRSLIGLGYYGTVTPGVIRRNVLENPGWYTAYTPYQPEISQGRLEALLTFQTMVAELTGMELANASLLDEATAAAEAMAMCKRVQQGAGDVFLVDPDCLPQTIGVIRTRAEALGIEVVVADPTDPGEVNVAGEVFAVLVQYPGASGAVPDLAGMVERWHAQGAMVVVAADLLACTLLAAPGDVEADVAVGTSQRFGVPMMYGGPHAGYLATSEQHKRALPGRLVGVSVDAAGRPATRLALQTREQHIRRERATSNICTSQVLLAVIAALYAVYHGPEGLQDIATAVHHRTTRLAQGLREAGLTLENDTWFDTVTVRVPGRSDDILATALAAGFNLRRVDDDRVALALDETCDDADVTALLAVFGADAAGSETENAEPSSLPDRFRRTTGFLTDSVFQRYRSETDMLRYLRRLADRDIALDRAMIPLGSCTMKLNATVEMEPISWPEFADLHPFAPISQAQGYLELIRSLEEQLAEITGYERVSLQPNAGSQGEYAGLLSIKRFHESRGDDQRTICLIPESAHGTNAASAVMAGMRVLVVDCDENGNIDVDDLKRKAVEHSDDLAALMVTYPSTHGVFEARITEVCDIVHEHGGQVYLDGANLNALVGVAKPGAFGSDVSHLNLHKTFCIPHGGGGPGVGPIGVRGHLAPFLPNHPLIEEAGPASGPGPVSAAPFGSPGILPISWAYITLMGAAGLRKATEVAILNANYVAKRLSAHFPVLYTGENGRVAHECILDVRPLQKRSGITNEDVAKRLVDYGFHAPTMSFPVAGTLMIEPTESESKAELDRFCDAMIAIRAEIDKVASGEWDAEDNPLRRAPHPAEDVTADDWDRGYSREVAAFPVPDLRRDKYWPPVSRIDQAYGDRHLACTCAPLEAYREDD